MPELSRRILNVKSSPTMALNTKAKALAKDGIKVLNFSVGEPDFKTPDSVVAKAIEALKAGKTKYGPAGGSPEFRKAIAEKLLRDNQMTYAPEDIVVGIGAKEILFHVFMSILNEGDEVIVPSPYWVSYPDQIIACGAKPVCLPVPDDIAKAPLNMSDLRRNASSRTVAIVLNSPNNPAGYMYDDAALKELGEFLKGNDWWIVSDEIYEYMAFDRPHKSLLQMFPELKDRFILVNGMSKGFAMTGWRVGYCAGPSKVMKMVRDLQSHSSTCLPPFIEEAATLAISAGKDLLAKEIAGLKDRRDLAVSLLKTMKGVKYVQPHGAFYVFIDVREPLKNAKEKLDSFQLSDRLLMQEHIALVPGDAFGAPGFLRLSYATDEASIKEGLTRLGKALQEL